MCLPPKLVYKDMTATPPTIPSGVELTAPATTVNAPPPAQVYKASIVASEGVESPPPEFCPPVPLFAIS